MDDLGLSSKTLDLETVSVDDLIARVPDLGLLCAEDIVDWRNSNGKFPDEATLTGALGLAPTLAKRVLELGSAKPAWVPPGTPGAVSAVAPEPAKKAVSAEDAELAACLFGDDDPPAKAPSAPVAAPPAASAPSEEDAELAACLFGDEPAPAAAAPPAKAEASAEDAELDACLFGDEPAAKPIPVAPVAEPVAEGLGLVAESLRPRGPDPVVRYDSDAIYEPTPSEAPFSMSSPPPEPEWPAAPAVIGARPPTVPKIDATLSGPFGVDDLDALIAEARGGDAPPASRHIAPPPPIPEAAEAAEAPVPHRPEQGSVSALEVAAPVVTKATSEPTLLAAKFSPSTEVTAPRAHHLDHPATPEERVREVDVKGEVAAKAAAATPAKPSKKSRFLLGVVVCVNAALIAGVIAVRTEGKRAQAPVVSLGADVAELRNDQLAAKASAEEARAKLDETRAKVDEQSRLLKKSVERVASLEQRQRDAEKEAKDRASKEAREIAVLASRVNGFEKRLEQPTSLGEALDVIDTVQGRPKPAPPVKPASEPKEAKEAPKSAAESSEHGHH